MLNNIFSFGDMTFKDVIVYGDQGISTEEYEKAMYGKLMKTQSEEEEEVKCMNDGNISMTMTNGLEQVRKDYKKFLYARATHSNHAI